MNDQAETVPSLWETNDGMIDVMLWILLKKAVSIPWKMWAGLNPLKLELCPLPHVIMNRFSQQLLQYKGCMDRNINKTLTDLSINLSF